MENLIYLIVKGLLAVYLLHRVFCFLFNPDWQNLWCFFTPKMRVKGKVIRPETAPHNIVGKSQTVYLEETPKEKPKTVEPIFSEDLEKTPAYEKDSDITDADVEDKSNELSGQEALDENEYFMSLDVEPDDNEISTGMTYEQISVALDVVQGKQAGDAHRSATARILYEVQGSDLFNFLETQAENELMIERLLKEHLDSSGELKPENIRKKRLEIEEFDMDKYV